MQKSIVKWRKAQYVLGSNSCGLLLSTTDSSRYSKVFVCIFNNCTSNFIFLNPMLQIKSAGLSWLNWDSLRLWQLFFFINKNTSTCNCKECCSSKFTHFNNKNHSETSDSKFYKLTHLFELQWNPSNADPKFRQIRTSF